MSWVVGRGQVLNTAIPATISFQGCSVQSGKESMSKQREEGKQLLEGIGRAARGIQGKVSKWRSWGG